MAGTKESLYAAIDVGTTKVATLVAKVSPAGAMEVIALGHATSEGMRKGIVVNPEELTDSVRRSVEEAEGMLGSKIPAAHVGITGGHLTCINEATAASDGGARALRTFTQEDVDRVLSRAVTDPDLKHRVVHVIPRSYRVDGLSGVRNPVGMSGEKLSAESHVVMGDAVTMDNLARVVRNAGVKVRGLVIEHLASADAVLTVDEREIGTVLVDIGGGTSDIAIYRDGAVWHTAALPVAGNQFTNDLVIGLGLPPTVAEATKLRYGSASTADVTHQDVVEVESGLGEHTRPISLLTMNQLLHDRAVELVRLILHKVGESGLVRIPAGGIVLTGGCANLPGLAEIAADYGRCNVRIGSPSSALGLPAELEHSSFSTAVGLLLWGIQHRHAGAVAPQVTLDAPVLERLKGWLSKLAPLRTWRVGA
jgi:cell division protein FtsA